MRHRVGQSGYRRHPTAGDGRRRDTGAPPHAVSRCAALAPARPRARRRHADCGSPVRPTERSPGITLDMTQVPPFLVASTRSRGRFGHDALVWRGRRPARRTRGGTRRRPGIGAEPLRHRRTLSSRARRRRQDGRFLRNGRHDDQAPPAGHRARGPAATSHPHLRRVRPRPIFCGALAEGDRGPVADRPVGRLLPPPRPQAATPLEWRLDERAAPF